MAFNFSQALGVAGGAGTEFNELDKVVYLPKNMDKVVIKLYPETVKGEPNSEDDLMRQLLSSTFSQVEDVYQGEKTQAFLARCVLLSGFEANNTDKVVFLKLPKSVVASIAEWMDDGEDILSPYGNAVVIRRKKSGGKIAYSVRVSKETFSSDPSQSPTKNVSQAANDFTEWKLGSSMGGKSMGGVGSFSDDDEGDEDIPF